MGKYDMQRAGGVILAERSMELDSIELAAAIFGNCDQNIHLLEKEFGVTAVCRGSQLRFTGAEADVAAAAHAVDGMVMLMQNHTPLEEQTVRYCISLARDGEEKRLRELTDDFVAVTTKGRPFIPRPWASGSIWRRSAKTPSPSAWGRLAPARPTWRSPWRSRHSSPRTSAVSS